MKRHSIITFLFFSCHALIGQTIKIEGSIKNQSSLKGLPFCSIAIKGTSKGTISTESGEFSLSADKKDTIVISSIGFKQKVLAAENMPRLIFLEESITELNELTIRANRKFKRKTIGNKSKSRYLFGGYNQYAFLIQNTIKEVGIIKNITIHLQPNIDKDNRFETVLRIRFYENDNNSPGADLLSNNIIIRIKENSKTISLDVSKYGIELPLIGNFVGIDLLGTYDLEGKFIPYNTNFKPVNIRLRFSEEANHITLSKFFGTDWRKVQYPGRDGNTNNVSALITAEINY
ncbi:MAG: carboxypeptidase-like regulatory domain-containing protein [Cyclobacteriaceae bacterium]|jgi:hypothetical protein|nr:carboxypeptidase-like regulatory domain-containing protein [Cyclobacteriaceae bacterium]